MGRHRQWTLVKKKKQETSEIWPLFLLLLMNKWHEQRWLKGACPTPYYHAKSMFSFARIPRHNFSQTTSPRFVFTWWILSLSLSGDSNKSSNNLFHLDRPEYFLQKANDSNWVFRSMSVPCLGIVGWWLNLLFKRVEERTIESEFECAHPPLRIPVSRPFSRSSSLINHFGVSKKLFAE